MQNFPSHRDPSVTLLQKLVILAVSLLLGSGFGAWFFTHPQYGSAIEIPLALSILLLYVTYPRPVQAHLFSYFDAKGMIMVLISVVLLWLGAAQIGRLKEPYANARCFLIFCATAFYLSRYFSSAYFRKAVYLFCLLSFVASYFFADVANRDQYYEHIKNAIPVCYGFLAMALAASEARLPALVVACVITVVGSALSFYRGFLFLGVVSALVHIVTNYSVTVKMRGRKSARLGIVAMVFSSVMILIPISGIIYEEWQSSESRYIQSVGKIQDLYNSVLYGDSFKESETLRMSYGVSLLRDIDQLIIPKGFGYFPDDPRLPYRVFGGGSIDSTWFYIAYHAGWLTFLLVAIFCVFWYLKFLVRLHLALKLQWTLMCFLTLAYFTLTAEAFTVPSKAVAAGLWLAYVQYWATQAVRESQFHARSQTRRLFQPLVHSTR